MHPSIPVISTIRKNRDNYLTNIRNNSSNNLIATNIDNIDINISLISETYVILIEKYKKYFC